MGRRFEVYSDHKPCLALKGISKLTNERMQRWAAALNTYDYVAFYGRGDSMKDCDALSRAAYIEYDPKTGVHPQDGEAKSYDVEVDSIAEGELPTTMIRGLTPWGRTWGGMAPMTNQVVEMNISNSINPEGVKRSQMDDPVLRDVILYLQDKISEISKQTKSWLKKIKKLAEMGVLEEDTLIHCSGPVGRRLWVPDNLRAVILHDSHDVPMAGHLGVSRTFQKIHFNYYWKGMRKDVEQWVFSCEKCSRFNVDPHIKVRAAQYVGPREIKAFERVSMDVMGPFTKTLAGNLYIFTITDLATRWVEAIPIVEYNSTTLAQIFLTQFCLRYGPPRAILTDGGKPFVSQLIQKVCKILQTQRHVASAYHAQANGVAERVHAVFQRGLAKLVDLHHADWDEVIPYVVHAYRTTPHAVTGLSPYYLVYGQECTTFLDLQLLPAYAGPLIQPEWTKFREELIARLQIMRQVSLDKIFGAQAELAKPEVPLREFEEGDLVRIRNFKKTIAQGRIFKWRPNFLGVYKILARRGPTEYVVGNVDNPKDIRKYNIDDIKGHREFALRSTLFSNLCPNTSLENGAPPFGSEEREVERVYNSKTVGKSEYYLVKYKGLDEAFNQWVVESAMNCPNLIADFRRRRSGTPAHTSIRRPLNPIPQFRRPEILTVDASSLEDESSWLRMAKLVQRGLVNRK